MLCQPLLAVYWVFEFFVFCWRAYNIKKSGPNNAWDRQSMAMRWDTCTGTATMRWQWILQYQLDMLQYMYAGFFHGRVPIAILKVDVLVTATYLLKYTQVAALVALNWLAPTTLEVEMVVVEMPGQCCCEYVLSARSRAPRYRCCTDNAMLQCSRRKDEADQSTQLTSLS